MDTQAGLNTDEPTRGLVDKLRSVRRSGEGRSEGEVRQALQEALRAEVGSLPEPEAARRLESARRYLIAEARQRDQHLEALEKEAASLRAERDRLLEENTRLKDDNPPPTVINRPTGISDKMREGLRQITSGKDVTPESLGLPSGEARLFRLMSALLLFALNYERGVYDLLMAIEVGPQHDTVLRKRQKKIIQKRFTACLDDESGSVKSLGDALDRNSRFLPELHAAYAVAIKHGARSLLDSFDPQPILDQSKAWGSHDWEKAFKSFRGLHDDLSSLAYADTWERFFQQAFNERLADYMKPATMED